MNVLLLLWVVLLFGFTLVDKGPSRTLQTPWFFYHLFWCLIPWLWLGLRQVFGGGLRRFGGVAEQGLGWFALLYVVSALCSGRIDFSLVSVPSALVPVGVAYVVLNLLGEAGAFQTRSELLQRGILVLLLSFAAISLGYWWLNAVVPWQARGEGLAFLLAARNGWPLGHSNYTAGVCILGVFWMLSLAISESRVWRALSVLAVLACGACLVSSGSRAGLLAFVAGAVAWVLGRLGRLGLRMRVSAYVAAALLGGLALLVVVKPDTLGWLGLKRSRQDFTTSDLQRRGMMDTGLRMVHGEPWTGVGAGMVPRAYLRRHADRAGAVDSVLQLHSTPLQLAAEAGIPCLAAALVVVVCALQRRAQRRLLPAAAAFLVYSLFDYQLDLPVIAALAGVLAALLLARERELTRPVETGWVPRFNGACLLAFLFAWAWAVMPTLRARQVFGQALEAFYAGDRALFVNLCENARGLDSREAFYPLVEAQLLADPDGHGAPVGRILPDGRAALSLFDVCLAIDPGQEAAHFNRAWLLLSLDPAAAAESFRKAAALVPARGLVYRGLGLALLAQGKRSEAVQAFARELANNPVHVCSPVWSGPVLAPVAGESRQAAVLLLSRAAEEAKRRGLVSEECSARYAAGLLRWLGEPAGSLPLEYATVEQAKAMQWLVGRGDFASPLGRESLAGGSEGVGRLLEMQLGRGLLVSQVLAALEKGDRLSLLRPGALPANAALVRYQRLGYGLAMRNLDAPVLTDLCLTQENPVVQAYLGGLFPMKGHLPSSLLDQAADSLARTEKP